MTVVLLAVAGTATAASVRFADVTRKEGLQEGRSLTWGLAWADYDGRRGPDLFVNHHWQPPTFFRNTGERFTRTGHDFYPYEVDRHGCAWGEANGDGRPDLFCAQGADFGRGRGRNQLLVQKDGGFVDRAGRFDVADPLGRGRTANWLDYDGDGDLDLFVGNNLRRGHPNVMFENTRGGFDRARVGLGEQLATVSSSWADWDIDGDPDLLVTQRKNRKSVAYENEAGRFFRIELPGISNRRWRATAWGDYDGDGLIDLHAVGGHRAEVLHNVGGVFETIHRLRLKRGRMSAWLDVDNDGDLDLFVVQGARGLAPDEGSRNFADFIIVQRGGAFRRVGRGDLRGPRRGNGDAVATGDYDRDGRVDLAVTNGHNPSTWTGRTELLRNRTESGRGAALVLRGGRRNPWGFGASIHVQVAPDLVYWRQVTDGFNYRSQSDPSRVHLGLGSHRTAQVRVLWPSGEIDCVTARSGRATIVPEGRRPCP